MPGRKTIMVDETIWNKIDDYKHDRRLRSIGDAISSALESATSKKYYAGIHAFRNGAGDFYHVAESLGRTEDEAVHRLIKFEGDELRPEDIPPASDVDINDEGYFIIECTDKMYLRGSLFTDEPFVCHITKMNNGDLIADIDISNRQYKYYNYVPHYCIVYRPCALPEDARYSSLKIGKIVDWGNTELLLEACWDFYDDYGEPYSPEVEPFNPERFNLGGLKVVDCTPRLFAECVGNAFQETLEYPDGNLESFPEFYCSLSWSKNGLIADTTPKGKYYAVVFHLFDEIYGVLSIGETANKAALQFFDEKCSDDDEIGDIWNKVYPSGERIGKYKDLDVLLVECTGEVYCDALSSCIKDDEDEEVGERSGLLCEIEGKVGERVARRYLEDKIWGLQKEFEGLQKELEEKRKGIVEMEKTEGEETEEPKND